MGNGWHGDAAADASVLFSFAVGRWHLYAKSGFRKLPQEGWELARKFLFT